MKAATILETIGDTPLGEHPRILGFNYDSSERYLSVADFLPE